MLWQTQNCTTHKIKLLYSLKHSYRHIYTESGQELNTQCQSLTMHTLLINDLFSSVYNIAQIFRLLTIYISILARICVNPYVKWLYVYRVVTRTCLTNPVEMGINKAVRNVSVLLHNYFLIYYKCVGEILWEFLSKWESNSN